jgi:hypothetical protein
MVPSTKMAGFGSLDLTKCDVSLYGARDSRVNTDPPDATHPRSRDDEGPSTTLRWINAPPC